MRTFWKMYAGFWLAAALFVAGALAIALMPALMVGGAAFLLPHLGVLSGNETQSLAYITAALGVTTAVLALGVFSLIYLTLRMVFRRLPRADISIPPAE